MNTGVPVTSMIVAITLPQSLGGEYTKPEEINFPVPNPKAGTPKFANDAYDRVEEALLTASQELGDENERN